MTTKTIEEILTAIQESQHMFSMDRVVDIRDCGELRVQLASAVVPPDEVLHQVTGVKPEDINFFWTLNAASVDLKFLPEGFADSFATLQALNPHDKPPDTRDYRAVYANTLTSTPWSKLIAPDASTWPSNLEELTQLPPCPTHPSESTP